MNRQQANSPTPEDTARALARMIGILERNRRRYINEKLQDSKLYGSMFTILLYVANHPGVGQDALTDHCYLDKTRIARLVRTLEDRKLLSRETDKNDRRKNKLYLTEAGEALLPRIRAALGEWSAVARQGIREEDYAVAHRVLAHMIENLGEKQAK